jgi:hypothetical protein
MLDRGLFIDNVADVLEIHGSHLRALIGKTLETSWVAWDTERDTWFADEAVILRVDSINLEIVCWKLDEVALTWNSIDLSAKPRWLADWGDEFALKWRQDALPALRSAKGKTIKGVYVVEYLYRTRVIEDRRHLENEGTRHEAWLLHGIELQFENKCLRVFNALDENGVTDEPPDDKEEFRRHAI